MTVYAEYFDRLDWDKRKALREIAGGELNWGKTVPKLTRAERLRFGEIVFGEPVKNVHIKYERNIATGYDIPIIFAEPGDTG